MILMEWPERPRGQACPTCGCLVGYGPQLEQDKVTHEDWHSLLGSEVLDLRRTPASEDAG